MSASARVMIGVRVRVRVRVGVLVSRVLVRPDKGVTHSQSSKC